MKNRINYDRSKAVQDKRGAGFYVFENKKSGKDYIGVLSEYGAWERWGSDTEDDSDDQDQPLFNDETKQKQFLNNRMSVFNEVYRTWRKGSDNNFVSMKGLNAKALLRDMKSGHQKIDLDFVKQAMGLTDDQYNALIEAKPRLAGNLKQLMDKPISTLRRAFSPKGDTFTREMIEDAGADDTIDLIAGIITKFMV